MRGIKLDLLIRQGADFFFPPFRLFSEAPQEVISGGLVTVTPGVILPLTGLTFAGQFRSPDQKGKLEAGGLAVLSFALIGSGDVQTVNPTLSAAATAQFSGPAGTYDIEVTDSAGVTRELYYGTWTLALQTTKDAP